MRILLITTVKNEAAFLLEWLAHHRAVGVTDFLIFSNDCTDGTDQMLDHLAAKGLLTHIPNPGPHPKGPQWQALAMADRHPLKAQADWLLVSDIDEFVNVHAGDCTIPALLKALPDADAIPLTWRLFGNAGVVGFKDTPVTEQFTQAAPRTLHWPWRAHLFKTLFRNDGTYAKLGVHRPRAPDPARVDQSRWVDGSGRPLPAPYRRSRLFTEPGSDPYALVQLNHYALGAMESYVLKCDRGRANRDASAFDMAYWVDRNFCQTEDRSILRHAPARAALVADWLTDPALAALHRAAVTWRHDRFQALMREEPWRALFGRLLITPPSNVLPEKMARAIWQMGT